MPKGQTPNEADFSATAVLTVAPPAPQQVPKPRYVQGLGIWVTDATLSPTDLLPPHPRSILFLAFLPITKASEETACLQWEVHKQFSPIYDFS